MDFVVLDTFLAWLGYGLRQRETLECEVVADCYAGE